MSISLDRVFGVHDEALQLRAQRTAVLASNIANADTPNYKAQDFDFAAALRQATGQQQSQQMVQTQPGHMGFSQNNGAPQVQYRVPHQSALDGNTVDLQAEQAKFARNAVEYQATLNFLEGKARGLIAAFKGE